MWLFMEMAYCLHSTRRITFSVWSGRASPWHRNVVATSSECCLDDPAARILGSVENPMSSAVQSGESQMAIFPHDFPLLDLMKRETGMPFCET